MEVVADLHIHSRFSIATGQQADLEHLDLWGRYKGLRVVGSGDCTHPAWLQELGDKLEEVAPGTYELKRELALPLEIQGPAWESVAPVRFLITGEVSAIYKKGGRVRKVHLVLLLPSLDAARRLSQRLGRLGNVTADGRPILGLDAKHILELTLEIDPQSLVIPAHIWTPWFSVLGAKSGFDSLEECFEERLADIYALETGLSSDPPMNWRVSQLDRFLLVSNSDAHSPQKVGREANIFFVPPTYPDLARAIRTQEGCGGTIEFFPQEGKYHLDGHRNCGLRLKPDEAKRLGGRCPHCGKPLTLGVMHRVADLADRETDAAPPGAQPFQSLIALPEVLGEVLEVGSGAKKVHHLYFRLLAKLGPELAILRRASLDRLAQEGSGLLAYAIDKMRRGEVHIAPGYDGVYGEIHLLSPEERRRHRGQSGFWSLPEALPTPEQVPLTPPPTAQAPAETVPIPPDPGGDPLLAGLNEMQQAVVRHTGAPLIVQAGPGTGKTRALTHRLAFLLQRRAVPPEHILAVTFTRQAAGEMAARIRELIPDFPGLDRLTIKTFHALGQQLLSEAGERRAVADEEKRRELLRRAAKASGLPAKSLEADIIAWKQALLYPEDPADEGPSAAWAAYGHYENLLAQESLWDYEDLIARPTRLLLSRPEMRAACHRRFRHLLVDEYQDVNEAQYRLFRALAGPAAQIMVIGDPHQAIYGFRGARPEYFSRFGDDWPQAVHYRLVETYRLPPPVLAAAQRLLPANGQAVAPMLSRRAGDLPVILMETGSAAGEARGIAREIERLVGGFSHRTLEDHGLRYQEEAGRIGFKDIAVLYRLHSLGAELERILTEAGIPCQQAREGVGPDWEDLDLAAEKVKLLTLHAAKGLEFPYIFIAGAEAGLLPFAPEGGDPADPEEERRLVYVGLTRALCQAIFTRARIRTLWGVKRRTTLSPLVAALAPEKMSQDRLADSPRRRQPGLFADLKPRRLKGVRD